MSLTPRQARFVEEYLVDFNAKDAAIRAGYSKKTAKQQGHKTLQTPAVQEAVTAAMEARSKRTEIAADTVVQELARIGFADMGDYVSIDPETGAVALDFSALPDDGTKIIQEIVQEDRVEGRGKDAVLVRKTKFKLYSKLDALEKLGRHLRIFTDPVVKHNHKHERAHDYVIIPADEVRAEIEEMFNGLAGKTAGLTATKH